MRKEKEIREELKGRRNAVQNLKFMFGQTGSPEFEIRIFESDVAVGVLEWVLGEKEMQEESFIVDTKTKEVHIPKTAEFMRKELKKQKGEKEK